MIGCFLETIDLHAFLCHGNLPTADTWCDSVEIYDLHQDNHFEEEDATIFEVDFHIEVPQLR